MVRKKRKAYEFETFAKARRNGFTRKQFENSKRGFKAWNSKSKLQKEITITNLKFGRRFKRQSLESQNFYYEVTSQSHYDARGKKYNTDFEFMSTGVFENKPNDDSIEKMIKNSLIGAFNNGKLTGNFLKKSAFDRLVDNHIRGISVKRVAASSKVATNKLSAELHITNNRTLNKWIGRN